MTQPKMNEFDMPFAKLTEEQGKELASKLNSCFNMEELSPYSGEEAKADHDKNN